MTSAISVRPLQPDDHAAWRPLWDGCNAFYGRFGATALPEHINAATWQRLLDPAEPMFCLMAQDGEGQLLGLAHYLFHRSTTRMEPICYLSDLYTNEAARGRGVGRALIDAVYAAARAAKASRVYWQTYETNTTARLLYDKMAKHHGSIVYSLEL
jgi:GNAT superfamily N-acetyltransferase